MVKGITTKIQNVRHRIQASHVGRGSSPRIMVLALDMTIFFVNFKLTYFGRIICYEEVIHTITPTLFQALLAN